MSNTHNMWSEEVAKMRYQIDVLGINKFKDSNRPTTYKQQALVELSLRLELEYQLEEMQKKMNKLISENEELKDGILKCQKD